MYNITFFQNETTDGAKKPDEIIEEKKTGTFDNTLYLRYLSLGFGYIGIPLLVLATVAPQACYMWNTNYLIEWTESRKGSTIDDLKSYDDYNYSVYMWGAAGTIFLAVARTLYLVLMVNR